VKTTQAVVETALLALQRLCFWIVHQHIVVQHAMADEDQAQFLRAPLCVRRQPSIWLIDVLLPRHGEDTQGD
jgi:hypothetical protein